MADLVVSVMNYGPDALNAQVELTSTSPHVNILDGSSTLGTVLMGEQADNSGDPFVVQASNMVPRGHVADFTLTASFTGGETISEFRMAVGQMEYFVWDPSPDNSSGPGINAVLRELGFSGGATSSLPIVGLSKYATLWISVGVYASNYVIPSTSPEASAIIDYLNAGGNVYLEGADLWAYDPGLGGYNFGPAFGIVGQADGSGDLFQVQGMAGTFAEGVAMYYGGENAYIDHLGATGTGYPLLRNSSPTYYCGIANDTGVYRTVGTSFEFGGLVDAGSPSTKADLASAIMNFFLPTDPADVPVGEIGFAGLRLHCPNPCKPGSRMQLVLDRTMPLEIDLIDVTGRRVQTLFRGPSQAGSYSIDLHQGQLSSGLYFVRTRSGEQRAAQKVIITE